MRVVFTLIAAIFLITGCSSKQYFEPEDTRSFSGDTESLSSAIVSFNRDGATLEEGEVISEKGQSTTTLMEGFTFINHSENGIISTNNKDQIAIGDQIIEIGSIVIAASIKNGILALVHSDNSVSAYDLKDNKTIFKEYYSKSFVNDVRIANPIFMTNIILFPTLDGKVIIVSSQNFKVIRAINVDASGKFNNISFLDVVNNTLIAATASKIVSVGDGVLNVKSYDIRDVISHGTDIYIATIDGQVIKTDISLNVQNRTKFKFAKIYSLVYGTSLYALESQGYLINISDDFQTETIYDFSFDEDDKVIAIKDTLYIGDEYIKLK